MTPPPASSNFRRYAAAVAVAAASVLVRYLAGPLVGPKFPYSAVLPAVLLVCRFWGVGPAVFVLLAGAAGTSAAIGDRDWQRLLLLMVVGAISIWVIQALRRAYSQAAESARLAEERLKTSARLQAVVESSRDAIISTDLNGIIQSWNAGAEQVFGYSVAEALGKPASILMCPDGRKDDPDILERGPVKNFETVRCRKDGKRIHISLSVSPILGTEHNPIGTSQIARDISAQKELQEQLRQSQKMESLGVLAGGLAHDFNNLLTGIMGNASLALDCLKDDDPVRTRMEEILNASDRAALLVRQMMAYAGKGRFVVESVNLSTEVVEILPLVRTSISRLVELDLILDEHLPPVEADRTQMQQLSMNLVVNAAEAIGDRPGVITIRTYARDSEGSPQVVLEVQDTGCGMEPEIQARIFDPFFTTKFPGRGLGLSAVMGIVHAHRGKIQVASTPAKGSTFTVALPVMAVREGATSAESTEELEGNGTVLVVDDEELIRGMARFTLERHGYRVEEAADGRSAVDAFAAGPQTFTAVLLDLTMPVMGGEDALELIRKIRPDVPVVLSSGFGEAEAASRFKDRGLAWFLQKPYTATELARKIKAAVSVIGSPERGATSPSGGGS